MQKSNSKYHIEMKQEDKNSWNKVHEKNFENIPVSMSELNNDN